MKIKKGDTVLIISGKDKGRKGNVLQVFQKEARVLIAEVNLRKKHQKPKKAKEKGQIVQIPGPIAISNVKLICSKCKKAVRIGYKTADNKKYRICKKCGESC